MIIFFQIAQQTLSMSNDFKSPGVNYDHVCELKDVRTGFGYVGSGERSGHLQIQYRSH
jgi:hypothetical protein